MWPFPEHQKRYSVIYRIVTTKYKFLITGEKALDQETLMLLIYEVEQYILNYCRIPFVPHELWFTWAGLASDYARYLAEVGYTPEDPMDSIDPSDLSSVKVGDTSVFMGDKYRSSQRSIWLQAHAPHLDELVLNYRDQLNEFRKLW